jgi:hypothetical protein
MGVEILPLAMWTFTNFSVFNIVFCSFLNLMCLLLGLLWFIFPNKPQTFSGHETRFWVLLIDLFN